MNARAWFRALTGLLLLLAVVLVASVANANDRTPPRSEVATLDANAARIESTKKMLREAPSFVIWADVSGSSPVFDELWIAQAVKVITPEVRALPLGATLVVFFAGDPTLVGPQWRTRIQSRADATGMTADQAANKVKAILVGIRPEKHSMGQSSLIGAMSDATRLLNPHATQPQTVIGLTDGVERSGADFSKVIVQRLPGMIDCYIDKCSFPPPNVVAPRGSVVRLYGIGIGVQTAKGQEIARAWSQYARLARYETVGIYPRF